MVVDGSTTCSQSSTRRGASRSAPYHVLPFCGFWCDVVSCDRGRHARCDVDLRDLGQLVRFGIVLHDPRAPWKEVLGRALAPSSVGSTVLWSSPHIIESSSGSPGVEVVSLSSGGMSSVDVKAYQALEVMKLCHNFDSIMTEELLGLVQEHYSISDSYELHAPQPKQCPYDSFPNGFGLSINELEVGL
ncbi:hypothetical protein B296_00020942 [Ensete ventricosum]|uniref:Uncharacterized protein n=1 Tax=Ensete ventricosum TaxID=4639 RepID=A0A427A700_ENSVE|nr:hypothetical protein B296_00020942 [Ensete ventricosum]